MKESAGSKGAALLECVNPKRDIWRLRWNMSDAADGTSVWTEEDFARKPTPGDIERTLSESACDATDAELEEIGALLGYGKEEFVDAMETERTARIASDPQAQLMEAMRELMSDRTDVPDAQALKVPCTFPTFSTLCRRGKEVRAGVILRHDNRLWRAVQAHTPQAAYPPSDDTAALYTRINRSHSGTKDDPIPYERNMAFVGGRYYSQYGVTYLCILATVTGYPYDLKDLPTIVQAV